MIILELCLSSGLGGLELYAYRSSQALADSRAQRNTVLAILSKNSKLDNYFRDNSNLNRKHIRRFFHPLPLFNALKLASIIDEHKVDVIHMHWGKDLPLAALGKVFSKQRPALVYTRQMMITRVKGDFYHNFLYRQMDHMLTITRELEILCKKYIVSVSKNISTLYYGVKPPEKFLDTDEICKHRESLGFSKTDFIAGIIGRLEESKGQYLVIQAIQEAKKSGHHIKALIVGHEMKPGYTEQLKKLACKLGVIDNTIFHEFVTQPQTLMQLCDCVILASGRETFGLVLAEAMRSGVAVIGSDSGGVLEIIDHRKTGLLFETKNSNSLFQQLESIYLDTDLKHRISNSGKNKADIYFNNETHFHCLEKTFLKVSEQ